VSFIDDLETFCAATAACHLRLTMCGTRTVRTTSNIRSLNGQVAASS
jgi:hypothetical protein